MTLLIGRGLCGPLIPVEVNPGAGSLTLTGYAPSISVTTGDLMLLNNFNGTNGATTFVDDVPGITWTTGGTHAVADLSTTIKKFGASSVRLEGSAGNTFVQGAGCNVDKAGDYSLEVWFYAATTFNGSIVLKTYTSTAEEFYVQIDDNGAYTFSAAGSNHTGGAGALTVNSETWTHMAIVRDGTNNFYDFFFDGDRIEHQTDATDISNNIIGVRLHSSSAADVHYDDVRLKNSIVYAGATYTAPSGEL